MIKKLITVAWLIASSAVVASVDGVVINTDLWPPYVNAQGQGQGSGAKAIELIARNADIDLTWEYTPYEFSFHLVKQGKAQLAFPYFKTEARAQEVLFSDPIFNVTSYLYFNRQFHALDELDQQDIEQLKMGMVAGYSYGEALDQLVQQAQEYNSEQQALAALLNNEIELLPMTEEVMNSTLERHFPAQRELVKPLLRSADQASLYLVASKTVEGEALLAQFNASLKQLRKAGIENIQPKINPMPTLPDRAKLVTAEGYPAIIGQTQENGELRYFTLPIGTQVLVLNWSDKMLQSSTSDRLYKNMMDVSEVVVLNGPHVGREFFIRNMHIELL